ncbi:MAG: hypothetical protein ACLGI5_03430 [Thermoleophilia bacterium]
MRGGEGWGHFINAAFSPEQAERPNHGFPVQRAHATVAVVKPDVRNQLERLLDYARAVNRAAQASPERSDIVVGGRGYLGGAVETMHYLSLLTDDEQHEWFERLMSELPPTNWAAGGSA